ncbi:DUF2975 domain-containing protein [Microbacterium sp. ZXX196]|uniref:DUF2975 domain-containing protein n=1 Tax=Microbacterium sp. ZXX196 TaxID=2609291 RepID=UPI0012B891F5|nr:DUF2975 domain-containing protein [Microbacterium sp. ZXX196]MTE23228.1 DUF2975 domain-containing protein [Microbacterium sp. ZXX196]
MALKAVIALALAGSVAVQAVVLPLAWLDAAGSGAAPWQAALLIGILGCGILTMRVFAVCVWRLLTLVRREAVFSEGAFRYVGAFVAAAALAAALGVLLRPGRRHRRAAPPPPPARLS